ncbi:MAG TPA: type I restriction enzyme HsdR N-terminal domain-containing protein, partial [Methylomirabilota bacterium]|nr:type I restriction enzyme HsdR N-terminal domain-containing protein [Methylomirabilota bacterium]
RQWTEKLFHDLYGYRWKQIRIECPVRMGHKDGFIDIAILKNENLPEESSNYLVLIELKSLLNGDDGKNQLFSYMRVTSAVLGYVIGGKDSEWVKVFSKTSSGIIEGEMVGFRTEGTKRPSYDLGMLNDNLYYCSMMNKILKDVNADPYYKKTFPDDWDGFFKYWNGKVEVVRDSTKRSIKQCERDD